MNIGTDTAGFAMPLTTDFQAARANALANDPMLKNGGQFMAKGKMGIEAIREKAQEFEAVFISQMLAPMFDGIGEEAGMFGGGHAEGMYRSMMIEEIGKEMAASGGIGIADQVAAQLIQMQEEQQ